MRFAAVLAACVALLAAGQTEQQRAADAFSLVDGILSDVTTVQAARPAHNAAADFRFAERSGRADDEDVRWDGQHEAAAAPLDAAAGGSARLAQVDESMFADASAELDAALKEAGVATDLDYALSSATTTDLPPGIAKTTKINGQEMDSAKLLTLQEAEAALPALGALETKSHDAVVGWIHSNNGKIPVFMLGQIEEGAKKEGGKSLPADVLKMFESASEEAHKDKEAAIKKAASEAKPPEGVSLVTSDKPKVAPAAPLKKPEAVPGAPVDKEAGEEKGDAAAKPEGDKKEGDKKEGDKAAAAGGGDKGAKEGDKGHHKGKDPAHAVADKAHSAGDHAKDAAHAAAGHAKDAAHAAAGHAKDAAHAAADKAKDAAGHLKDAAHGAAAAGAKSVAGAAKDSLAKAGAAAKAAAGHAKDAAHAAAGALGAAAQAAGAKAAAGAKNAMDAAKGAAKALGGAAAGAAGKLAHHNATHAGNGTALPKSLSAPGAAAASAAQKAAQAVKKAAAAASEAKQKVAAENAKKSITESHPTAAKVPAPVATAEASAAKACSATDDKVKFMRYLYEHHAENAARAAQQAVHNALKKARGLYAASVNSSYTAERERITEATKVEAEARAVARRKEEADKRAAKERLELIKGAVENAKKMAQAKKKTDIAGAVMELRAALRQESEEMRQKEEAREAVLQDDESAAKEILSKAADQRDKDLRDITTGTTIYATQLREVERAVNALIDQLRSIAKRKGDLAWAFHSNMVAESKALHELEAAIASASASIDAHSDSADGHSASHSGSSKDGAAGGKHDDKKHGAAGAAGKKGDDHKAGAARKTGAAAGKTGAAAGKTGAAAGAKAGGAAAAKPGAAAAKAHKFAQADVDANAEHEEEQQEHDADSSEHDSASSYRFQQQHLEHATSAQAAHATSHKVAKHATAAKKHSAPVAHRKAAAHAKKTSTSSADNVPTTADAVDGMDEIDATVAEEQQFASELASTVPAHSASSKLRKPHSSRFSIAKRAHRTVSAARSRVHSVSTSAAAHHQALRTLGDEVDGILMELGNELFAQDAAYGEQLGSSGNGFMMMGQRAAAANDFGFSQAGDASAYASSPVDLSGLQAAFADADLEHSQGSYDAASAEESALWPFSKKSKGGDHAAHAKGAAHGAADKAHAAAGHAKDAAHGNAAHAKGAAHGAADKAHAAAGHAKVAAHGKADHADQRHAPVPPVIGAAPAAAAHAAGAAEGGKEATAAAAAQQPAQHKVLHSAYKAMAQNAMNAALAQARGYDENPSYSANSFAAGDDTGAGGILSSFGSSPDSAFRATEEEVATATSPIGSRAVIGSLYANKGGLLPPNVFNSPFNNPHGRQYPGLIPGYHAPSPYAFQGSAYAARPDVTSYSRPGAFPDARDSVIMGVNKPMGAPMAPVTPMDMAKGALPDVMGRLAALDAEPRVPGAGVYTTLNSPYFPATGTNGGGFSMPTSAASLNIFADGAAVSPASLGLPTGAANPEIPSLLGFPAPVPSVAPFLTRARFASAGLDAAAEADAAAAAEAASAPDSRTALQAAQMSPQPDHFLGKVNMTDVTNPSPVASPESTRLPRLFEPSVSPHVSQAPGPSPLVDVGSKPQPSFVPVRGADAKGLPPHPAGPVGHSRAGFNTPSIARGPVPAGHAAQVPAAPFPTPNPGPQGYKEGHVLGDVGHALDIKAVPMKGGPPGATTFVIDSHNPLVHMDNDINVKPKYDPATALREADAFDSAAAGAEARITNDMQRLKIYLKTMSASLVEVTRTLDQRQARYHIAQQAVEEAKARAEELRRIDMEMAKARIRCADGSYAIDGISCSSGIVGARGDTSEFDDDGPVAQRIRKQYEEAVRGKPEDAAIDAKLDSKQHQLKDAYALATKRLALLEQLRAKYRAALADHQAKKAEMHTLDVVAARIAPQVAKARNALRTQQAAVDVKVREAKSAADRVEATYQRTKQAIASRMRADESAISDARKALVDAQQLSNMTEKAKETRLSADYDVKLKSGDVHAAVKVQEEENNYATVIARASEARRAAELAAEKARQAAIAAAAAKRVADIKSAAAVLAAETAAVVEAERAKLHDSEADMSANLRVVEGIESSRSSAEKVAKKKRTDAARKLYNNYLKMRELQKKLLTGSSLLRVYVAAAQYGQAQAMRVIDSGGAVLPTDPIAHTTSQDAKAAANKTAGADDAAFLETSASVHASSGRRLRSAHRSHGQAALDASFLQQGDMPSMGGLDGFAPVAPTSVQPLYAPSHATHRRVHARRHRSHDEEAEEEEEGQAEQHYASMPRFAQVEADQQQNLEAANYPQAAGYDAAALAAAQQQNVAAWNAYYSALAAQQQQQAVPQAQEQVPDARFAYGATVPTGVASSDLPADAADFVYPEAAAAVEAAMQQGGELNGDAIAAMRAQRRAYSGLRQHRFVAPAAGKAAGAHAGEHAKDGAAHAAAAEKAHVAAAHAKEAGKAAAEAGKATAGAVKAAAGGLADAAKGAAGVLKGAAGKVAAAAAGAAGKLTDAAAAAVAGAKKKAEEADPMSEVRSKKPLQGAAAKAAAAGKKGAANAPKPGSAAAKKAAGKGKPLTKAGKAAAKAKKAAAKLAAAGENATTLLKGAIKGKNGTALAKGKKGSKKAGKGKKDDKKGAKGKHGVGKKPLNGTTLFAKPKPRGPSAEIPEIAIAGDVLLHPELLPKPDLPSDGTPVEITSIPANAPDTEKVAKASAHYLKAAQKSAAVANLLSRKIGEASKALAKTRADHITLTEVYFATRLEVAKQLTTACTHETKVLQDLEEQTVSDTERLAAKAEMQAQAAGAKSKRLTMADITGVKEGPGANTPPSTREGPLKMLLKINDHVITHVRESSLEAAQAAAHAIEMQAVAASAQVDAADERAKYAAQRVHTAGDGFTDNARKEVEQEAGAAKKLLESAFDNAHSQEDAAKKAGAAAKGSAGKAGAALKGLAGAAGAAGKAVAGLAGAGGAKNALGAAAKLAAGAAGHAKDAAHAAVDKAKAAAHGAVGKAKDAAGHLKDAAHGAVDKAKDAAHGAAGKAHAAADHAKDAAHGAADKAHAAADHAKDAAHGAAHKAKDAATHAKDAAHAQAAAHAPKKWY